jgi:hypothetical protein
LLLLWRLVDKHGLSLRIQLMKSLCQHTLILVVEHIPTQSESIRGIEHVRLEQLRVPLADMLQGPALNNMVCDILNW